MRTSSSSVLIEGGSINHSRVDDATYAMFESSSEPRYSENRVRTLRSRRRQSLDLREKGVSSLPPSPLRPLPLPLPLLSLWKASRFATAFGLPRPNSRRASSYDFVPACFRGSVFGRVLLFTSGCVPCSFGSGASDGSDGGGDGASGPPTGASAVRPPTVLPRRPSGEGDGATCGGGGFLA